MGYKEIVKKLESLSDPRNIEGMARYGITPKHAYGVTMPVLRDIAKEVGKNHELAQKLWATDTRETRIIASLIEDPDKVTEKQTEEWVKEFYYWDICDQCCMNLFWKLNFAGKKAKDWTKRKEEFVKRAGFVIIAKLGISDKKADDRSFEQFFPIIKREATDERKMVMKAISWALRQIGKRNLRLNKKAIALAKEIQKKDSKAAKWIASDVLKELTSSAVQKRLQIKKK